MSEWKLAGWLTTSALAAAVAIYWDAAVAPEMVSQQALRQVEFHTDGSGDRSAAQRRLLAWGQHLPAEIAGGAAALALLLLVWSVTRGAKRGPAPAADGPATGGQT